MQVETLDNLFVYQKASYFTSVFSRAVKKAKEINRQNGLPNNFVINGKTYYELPNGEIVTENPLKGSHPPVQES